MSLPKTETLWTASVGGFFSTMAYLIGGVDNIAIAFGIFMVADWLSGVLAAIYTGGFRAVSSKRSLKGAAKKSGMILFVIVANQLDIISGNETGFIRNALILILIGTEGISIIENLGKMDIVIPSFIKRAFDQLRAEPEGKVDDRTSQNGPKESEGESNERKPGDYH